MSYDAGGFTSYFPAIELEFGFSRNVAEHQFIFRDEALLQNLGRKNRTWKFSIPFRENLVFASYRYLYTEQFPIFFAACQSSEAGILTTPDLGDVRVLCASFSYKYMPDKRDGCDVDVTFVSAPVDTDAPLTVQVPSDDALASQGDALDSQVSKANFGTETKPPSFGDPFKAVSSVFDQISHARDKNFSKIDKEIESINSMQDSLDRVSDPKNWSLSRQAADYKATLVRAKQQTESQGQRLKEIVIGRDSPINAVASSLGVTMQQLLTLNPMLAAFPFIPSGTTVRYQAKDGQKKPNV